MSPNKYGEPLGELPGSGFIEYSFPLRADLTAYLTLPRDLSAAEAGRLSVFLETLIDVNKTSEPWTESPAVTAPPLGLQGERDALRAQIATLREFAAKVAASSVATWAVHAARAALAATAPKEVP